MLAPVEATKNFYFCFQRKEWTLDAYATEFKARIQACEALGLSVGLDDGIVKTIAADEEPALHGQQYSLMMRNTRRWSDWQRKGSRQQ